MEYNKQNFEAGTILTATALNAMDDLIITNITSIETYKTKVAELEEKITAIESLLATIEETIATYHNTAE